MSRLIPVASEIPGRNTTRAAGEDVKNCFFVDQLVVIPLIPCRVLALVAPASGMKMFFIVSTNSDGCHIQVDSTISRRDLTPRAGDLSAL